MLKTTIGNLVVRSGLPEELQGFDAVLDKKGLDKLLGEAAKLGPDTYRDVSKHLLDVGRQAAQHTGGDSFGPEHLRVSVAGRKAQFDLNKQVRAIYANPKFDDETKSQRVVDLLIGAGDKLTDDVMRESLSEHNPLAMQIVSGSRGNPTNLRSLRAGDLLYVDHRNRPIPVPILRSYSQGLTPAEFYAGTFGARKGVLSAKFATRDTGYLSKQLVQASHRLVVTGLDYDGAADPGAGPRGLPSRIDDPHNEGSLLAADLGPYKRNAVLTPKIIADLRDRGFERLLVRSPTVGGHPNGGLYARDLGVREKGGLPPVGDFVGISAAQALSEPVTQGALGEKHGGGVAKGGRPVGPSGFTLIDQYVQEPKTFQGGAAHAQVDGKVTAVAPAPQGGTYVVVAGQKHYVGRGYDALVKTGDEVEAGDVLSDGLPIPAEIVKHKGIGEGRRYFTEAMVKAYKDSNIAVHRRNVEVLARALIDHVELDDTLDEHVPGDVVSYSAMEHKYRPRSDHAVVPIGHAKGLYLERPVLHYSIGTQVKPSVLKTLDEFGVKNVAVHHEPPPFQPRMIRGMENLAHDEDWMVKFLGSYLKKGFLASAHRGAVSDEKGTSFVPALARGVNFGKEPPVKGWQTSGETPKPPVPAPSIAAQSREEPLKQASVGSLFQRAKQASSIKAAEDDAFAAATKEHEAGHVVELDGDDDNEPRRVVYPVPQHRLASHRDEAGDPLAVFHGSDTKGRSGSFEIFRPGNFRRKTKFYRHCTEEEQDKLLRAFAPLLADMPKLHKSPAELLDDLQAFSGR